MATIYKRGRSWYLQWAGPNGQERISLTKNFQVKTEYEAKNYKLAKELELGTGQTILSSAPRFETFSGDYLEWYKYEYPASYDRMVQIVSSLLPFFSKMPINLLEAPSVEQWKTSRLKAVSAGTVAKEFRGFKAMIKRAVEWGVISSHPFQYVKAPKDVTSKPPSFYSKDQMQTLYQVGSEYRWHWQLLSNTGIRRGEALNLKITDVFKDRIRVLSEVGARTKSAKWREVPINKSASEAIAALLANDPKVYVLPRVNPVSLSRAFDRDRLKAGLDGNLHWLRHTFISHLIMSGMNLRKVQLLAGHANYSTTERYAHLAPDHFKDLGGVEI